MMAAVLLLLVSLAGAQESRIAESKVTGAQAAAGNAEPPAAAAAEAPHELELLRGGTAEMQAAGQVFLQLGASQHDAAGILQRVAAEGKAVVMEGPRETLDQIAAAFKELGLDSYAGTGVDVLDGRGFAAQLSSADAAPALVVFFAPWCGHCKKMVPEVAKAASKLRVRVVAVDCDRAPEVARALGIKGYPTVKFMARGKASGYEGPRTALQLASFAQSRAALDRYVLRWVDKAVAAVRNMIQRPQPSAAAP
ncbi:hypothetical protein EMIHUDRAFT_201331 [Emiliania huxleyi CCMP1516]|uniref:Thioredoxin domain-containing protein n=2 Tax=Emiliania huxleyi TaxID=2903 RepID=A0A0D3KHT1_EMIH1|nr:hypothetical protein EMIHUDRAFT_201331 [Emiliania huxleyi CCMP1516]EOD35316.1 hypothetical protein EMIHUDRAFT_201331 [Emiliania huxleyi CCMP1516]|eukprot:XP_005787745.1 hypothetical protein EMIHUDRAFT_201331 [Emiliania huxleyi CCMP1516]